MTGYPLTTLLALREREVDAALASLARAMQVAERHRADLLRQEELLARHVERAREAGRGVAADASGPGDLASRARWAERLRAELSLLAAARAAAEVALGAVEGDVAALRDASAAARAALRALEVHREGWCRERARARDRREQDAADDLVSARRGAP